MKAIVTVEFMGVADGDIYPRRFTVGEPVTGDIAAVALNEGWAMDPAKSDSRPRKKTRIAKASEDQTC